MKHGITRHCSSSMKWWLSILMIVFLLGWDSNKKYAVMSLTPRQMTKPRLRSTESSFPTTFKHTSSRSRNLLLYLSNSKDTSSTNDTSSIAEHQLQLRHVKQQETSPSRQSRPRRWISNLRQAFRFRSTGRTRLRRRLLLAIVTITTSWKGSTTEANAVNFYDPPPLSRQAILGTQPNIVGSDSSSSTMSSTGDDVMIQPSSSSQPTTTSFSGKTASTLKHHQAVIKVGAPIVIATGTGTILRTQRIQKKQQKKDKKEFKQVVFNNNTNNNKNDTAISLTSLTNHLSNESRSFTKPTRNETLVVDNNTTGSKTSSGGSPYYSQRRMMSREQQKREQLFQELLKKAQSVSSSTTTSSTSNNNKNMPRQSQTARTAKDDSKTTNKNDDNNNNIGMTIPSLSDKEVDSAKNEQTNTFVDRHYERENDEQTIDQTKWSNPQRFLPFHNSLEDSTTTTNTNTDDNHETMRGETSASKNLEQNTKDKWSSDDDSSIPVKTAQDITILDKQQSISSTMEISSLSKAEEEVTFDLDNSVDISSFYDAMISRENFGNSTDVGARRQHPARSSAVSTATSLSSSSSTVEDVKTQNTPQEGPSNSTFPSSSFTSTQGGGSDRPSFLETGRRVVARAKAQRKNEKGTTRGGKNKRNPPTRFSLRKQKRGGNNNSGKRPNLDLANKEGSNDFEETIDRYLTEFEETLDRHLTELEEINEEVAIRQGTTIKGDSDNNLDRRAKSIEVESRQRSLLTARLQMEEKIRKNSIASANTARANRILLLSRLELEMEKGLKTEKTKRQVEMKQRNLLSSRLQLENTKKEKLAEANQRALLAARLQMAKTQQRIAAQTSTDNQQQQPDLEYSKQLFALTGLLQMDNAQRMLQENEQNKRAKEAKQRALLTARIQMERIARISKRVTQKKRTNEANQRALFTEHLAIGKRKKKHQIDQDQALQDRLKQEGLAQTFEEAARDTEAMHRALLTEHLQLEGKLRQQRNDLVSKRVTEAMKAKESKQLSSHAKHATEAMHKTLLREHLQLDNKTRAKQSPIVTKRISEAKQRALLTDRLEREKSTTAMETPPAAEPPNTTSTPEYIMESKRKTQKENSIIHRRRNEAKQRAVLVDRLESEKAEKQATLMGAKRETGAMQRELLTERLQIDRAARTRRSAIESKRKAESKQRALLTDRLEREESARLTNAIEAKRSMEAMHKALLTERLQIDRRDREREDEKALGTELLETHKTQTLTQAIEAKLATEATHRSLLTERLQTDRAAREKENAIVSKRRSEAKQRALLTERLRTEKTQRSIDSMVGNHLAEAMHSSMLAERLEFENSIREKEHTTVTKREIEAKQRALLADRLRTEKTRKWTTATRASEASHRALLTERLRMNDKNRYRKKKSFSHFAATLSKSDVKDTEVNIKSRSIETVPTKDEEIKSNGDNMTLPAQNTSIKHFAFEEKWEILNRVHRYLNETTNIEDEEGILPKDNEANSDSIATAEGRVQHSESSVVGDRDVRGNHVEDILNTLRNARKELEEKVLSKLKERNNDMTIKDATKQAKDAVEARIRSLYSLQDDFFFKLQKPKIRESDGGKEANEHRSSIADDFAAVGVDNPKCKIQGKTTVEEAIKNIKSDDQKKTIDYNELEEAFLLAFEETFVMLRKFQKGVQYSFQDQVRKRKEKVALDAAMETKRLSEERQRALLVARFEMDGKSRAMRKALDKKVRSKDEGAFQRALLTARLEQNTAVSKKTRSKDGEAFQRALLTARLGMDADTKAERIESVSSHLGQTNEKSSAQKTDDELRQKKIRPVPLEAFRQKWHAVDANRKASLAANSQMGRYDKTEAQNKNEMNHDPAKRTSPLPSATPVKDDNMNGEYHLEQPTSLSTDKLFFLSDKNVPKKGEVASRTEVSNRKPKDILESTNVKGNIEQQLSKSNKEEVDLIDQYGSIEDVGERAFKVLLDLGMIEISPDPDSPDYDSSADDEFVQDRDFT